jgi:hypothetical protein
MRVAWRPNALSEAPRQPGGVQLVPDRSWTCDAAEWNADQKRFEWPCGTSARASAPAGAAPATTPARLDFPTRVEMSVLGCAESGRECPGAWTNTLRYPGQVLTGDIDSAARTLVVEWDGWCKEARGRAQWTMDRITAIEVETTHGTKLSLFPPECGRKPRAWTRQPLPGLQPHEPLKVSFWGDRRFRSRTWRIAECGSADPDAAFLSPNCLVLQPPEDATRTGQRRLRRDSATVGVGIAGGLYGTRVSAKDFYGPISEFHLNVLLRGLPTPWQSSVRLDADLRGVVSFQTWSAFRCRGSCEPGGSEDLMGNFERAERQRDSMLAARLQPGLRLAAFHAVFFGAHPFVGYGAPPIRRGGNEQVPLQVLWGGGLSVAWYISPAVAFEVQGNWTSALARFLTFDPSGVVSSVEARAEQWSGLFGLRFDDLAGD